VFVVALYTDIVFSNIVTLAVVVVVVVIIFVYSDVAGYAYLQIGELLS
jgi:hypothetical protein